MRWFILVSLILGSAPVLLTQKAPAVVVLRGYVVDASCGAAMAGKPAALARAARHTKACALDEACAAAGYGIVANGNWVKFDAKGDSLAKRTISASRRERGHFCEVRGSMKGDRFVVASLREAAEPK